MPTWKSIRAGLRRNIVLLLATNIHLNSSAFLLINVPCELVVKLLLYAGHLTGLVPVSRKGLEKCLVELA